MSSPVRVSAVDVVKGLTLFRTSGKPRVIYDATDGESQMRDVSTSNLVSAKPKAKNVGAGLKTLSLD